LRIGSSSFVLPSQSTGSEPFGFLTYGYAVLALLVYEPYSSSKHSGVLSYFNKRFIKEHTFPEALERSLNKAFELRQRGDFREYITLHYEQIDPFIGQAEAFLLAVKDYLRKAHKGVGL